MELGPIPGIRGLGPVQTLKIEREVEPPFRLDPSGRMGDDAYNGARQEAKRGMEEEVSDTAEEESEKADTLSTPNGPDTGVSFFA